MKDDKKNAKLVAIIFAVIAVIITTVFAYHLGKNSKDNNLIPNGNVNSINNNVTPASSKP